MTSDESLTETIGCGPSQSKIKHRRNFPTSDKTYILKILFQSRKHIFEFDAFLHQGVILGSDGFC